MKKLMTIAAASALVLGACGSDGGSGGGSAAAAKDTLFNELMSEFDADADVEGASVDEGCIRELIDDIPDDQAVLIAENLDAEEAPPGVDESTVEALFSGLFGCVEIDFGALTDE